MRDAIVELVPVGQDASDARPGDFLLCHRRGLVARIIRFGTRSTVSHAAFVETALTINSEPMLIEALTRGTVRTPLSAYREVEYWIVRTGLEGVDVDQAVAFARSCLGDEYGFLTDLGIGLRFLTPGRGLWFGMSGTEVCSGLVAQAEVRGPVIYPWDPASCSPGDLLRFYVP